ncbi:MAG: hypothetical protein JW787_10010 [Sedimentisphaerales bacterium]|nr:hypothetical protein [Sedimentisphaerales bacterium]
MKVFVECFPDTALLRYLGIPKKQLCHESCKGEVVKRVLKSDSAIGLIDEDPASSQPRDLSNYKQIRDGEGLRFLIRNNDEKKKFIIVCPRLENWFIERAKLSGIQPENYGIPNNTDRLHSIPRYDKKEGFQRFLAELKEKDKGMNLLHQWLFENIT